MGTKKITGYKCPHCGDFTEYLDIGHTEKASLFVCEVCDTSYPSKAEADACCKDQVIPERWV
jgi:transposase-like protein